MLRYLPVLFLLAAMPAAAQEPLPAARYVFTPVAEGALRLDTQTGEVALCSGTTGAGGCRLLPDQMRDVAQDAAADDDRIAALEARVAALEARLRTAEHSLPDEEAVDRVMDLTERMMRRFFGLVRELKSERPGETL